MFLIFFFDLLSLFFISFLVIIFLNLFGNVNDWCAVRFVVVLWLKQLLFVKYGGMTPLHKAVEKSSAEIVRILVEHGATIDYQNGVLIFFHF